MSNMEISLWQKRAKKFPMTPYHLQVAVDRKSFDQKYFNVKKTMVYNILRKTVDKRGSN